MIRTVRSLFILVSQPKGYTTLLAAGVALISVLAVRGGFAHAARLPHQAAWAFLALGVFGWMASENDSKPDRWRGAARCLAGYVLIGCFFLYPLLTSDGDFYYGLTRTMLWNRDLNTMEEGARFSNSWMVERAAEGSAYGFPYHPFPIGASLFWIPFVGLGHLEAVILKFFDPTLALNGYSPPYLHWLAVGTATLGAGFVLFGYLLLRRWFSHNISCRATLGTLLATPAAYYCFRDIGFPHAASMAAIALFLWAWLRCPGRSDRNQILLLSAALSLAALVRWQNCLFALAPMTYWATNGRGTDSASLPFLSRVSRILSLGVMCVFFCFPQILLFRLRGPTWLALQHSGSQDFFWMTPKLFSLFFDGRYGLFAWHPFYLVCLTGAVIALSRERFRGFLIAVVPLLLFVPAAYAGESRPWLLPLILALFLWPYILAGQLPFSSRVAARPLALVFACAAAEVYINASYLLYHGGGEYGNRLVCDLAMFAAIGFAYLLHHSDRYRYRWVVAAAYTLCFGWSLALLWKAVPKWTRSPLHLTEIFSHTTPWACMVQGIGHLDAGLFLSGIWRLICLGLCVGVLMLGVFLARSRWGNAGRAPIPLMTWAAFPVLISLWMVTDFRRVDATLFLDNRESGHRVDLAASTLWRQTLNRELSPFIPPGPDKSLPGGVPRFHQVLGSRNPTISWLFPKKWYQTETGEWEAVSYLTEEITLLSRVWAARILKPGEPIAEIEVARRVPPVTRTWTLRAGIHTSAPDSLDLPPSSPDWYVNGLGSIPRYFTSEFPMNPTAELDVLKISLIPRDVTLELGAVWFSRAVTDRPIPWARNPAKNRLPEVDRALFGRNDYRFVPFPGRSATGVAHPDRFFARLPRKSDRPKPEFLFFQDPWRLSSDGVPFELQMGNWRGGRRSDWHVLEPSHSSLTVSLGEEPVVSARVAIVPGPMPSRWEMGPVAFVRGRDMTGKVTETAVIPGRDAAFWGEPYLPRNHVVWRETRGFFPPVGITAVGLDCPPDRSGFLSLEIELSPQAEKKGASLAIMGITTCCHPPGQDRNLGDDSGP